MIDLIRKEDQIPLCLLLLIMMKLITQQRISHKLQTKLKTHVVLGDVVSDVHLLENLILLSSPGFTEVSAVREG